MSYITANKTIGFKYNDERTEFINKAFEAFGVDPKESKSNQFYEFVALALKQKTEQEIKPPNEEISELKAELTRAQDANTDLLFAVDDKDSDLKEEKKITIALQAKISELEDQEDPPPPAATPRLKENEYLITLPPFQHHLIASVANNINTLSHFDRVAEQTKNLILSMPHVVKENVAVAMVNFTVGAILNYHKG